MCIKEYAQNKIRMRLWIFMLLYFVLTTVLWSILTSEHILVIASKEKKNDNKIDAKKVNSTKKSSQEAPNWVTKHQEKHLVEHVKKIS